jgi:hypothetical protein
MMATASKGGETLEERSLANLKMICDYFILGVDLIESNTYISHGKVLKPIIDISNKFVSEKLKLSDLEFNHDKVQVTITTMMPEIKEKPLKAAVVKIQAYMNGNR